MKRKYLILFALSGLIVSLDQLLKQWLHSTLSLGQVRGGFGTWLQLTHVRNNGFAFGMLQHAAKPIQDVFFIGIPVFALVLIVLIFIKLRDNQLLPSLALTSILGGAVGNLIDRMQHGYVIDIVRMGAFPPFNLADVAILAGVAILFIHTLIFDNKGAAA